MPNLATWMREKDEKWFAPFFAKHPEIKVHDARTCEVALDEVDGLLLTGGSDIAAEFLRQEIVDPNLIEDADPARDRWELEIIPKTLEYRRTQFLIRRPLVETDLAYQLRLDPSCFFHFRRNVLEWTIFDDQRH